MIPAGRIVLRPPVEADAEAIAEGCADPDIIRHIPSIPVPYSRDDALAYIRTFVQETWAHGGASFAIADAASDRWLGNIGLKPMNVHGSGEIGYLMAPWGRGRGLTAAATRALTAWAFSHGLPRAEIMCDVENVPSQRVAMAAGYVREGVLRGGETQRDGSRYDLVLFARLPGDSGEPVRPYLPPVPGGSLTDGVVRLTPLTSADADDYHALACEPDVVRFSVPPVPPSYEEIVHRCRYAGTRWLAGERADFSVRDAETGAYVGQIQLSNIIPALDEAMIGYSTRPEYRGRGYTPRAVELLVSWAFAATPLVRLIAGTAPENTASHRVLEKTGFTREGLLRGRLPGLDGARRDDVQWVRLRP
ncbi:GNAT family N-acetyltransferase [Thermopolyspora sp. NPDC052614]|uniref:GNAT family N-acetyltransferase n=1 Tax=Thermopolyspora sp. NPDC052614 TaxID=3155682 RepID=UPI00342D5F85